MPFDAIIGHRRPVELLQSMLRTGQMPHAFIFYGIEGIGKQTVALAFAKALNCRELQADFCGRCRSCEKIERQMHPDVVQVEPEKNVIKIEQIRELQQQIAYRPVEGQWKAVIIDQADRLTAQAANCLLKTLEEPPDSTVLVLVSRGIAGMLPTVLSRCQQIRFAPLSDMDINGYLCRSGIEADRAAQVVGFAQGSIKRALFLATGDFLKRRAAMAAVLSQGSARHASESLSLAAGIADDSEATVPVLEFLHSWYRDLLLLHEGLTGPVLHNRDMADALCAARRHETRDSIVRKIQTIQSVQNTLVMNVDVQLALESILLQN
jgi:DNA polymerase-3 subunit delta'